MYSKLRSTGFTLIELVVTLAVAAIILGMVVPSFQNLIRNNQVSTEANAFMGAVQFARSEAVKRGGGVALSANGADFSSGWCVHTGADCNATVIREFDAPAAQFASGFTTVTFNHRGERAGGAGDLTLEVRPANCKTGEVGVEREIRILPSGQVRIAKSDCP